MPQLDEIVQLGQDVISFKYYSVATGTLLFYDYLLTLGDEVRYAWKGRKSWVFGLYVLNRYLPMFYMIWAYVSNFSWGYTDEMCSKTAFINILFFVWCTLIAQIVMSARIYAVTMKNLVVGGLFACISTAQLGLGMYLTFLTASAPAQSLPPIHLAPYKLCAFTRHRKMELAYIAMSLSYDLLAFFMIIYSAKSGIKGAKIPRILRTIVQDAALYFLIVFVSHFIFEMTIALARPTLQLLPASGNDVYLSVMICRLMLSLKKAADNPTGWTLTDATQTSGYGHHISGRSHALEFAPVADRHAMVSTGEDVPLATISSPLPAVVSGRTGSSHTHLPRVLEPNDNVKRSGVPGL